MATSGKRPLIVNFLIAQIILTQLLMNDLGKDMSGKRNIQTVFDGILERHPELTIPLKYVKYPDRILYKKRPKRKISTRNSY